MGWDIYGPCGKIPKKLRTAQTGTPRQRLVCNLRVVRAREALVSMNIEPSLNPFVQTINRDARKQD